VGEGQAKWDLMQKNWRNTIKSGNVAGNGKQGITYKVPINYVANVIFDNEQIFK
jgi:hypothetical protein